MSHKEPPQQLDDFVYYNYSTRGKFQLNDFRFFWNSTDFVVGEGGKKLIEAVKNQIINPKQKFDWDDAYAADIDNLGEDITANLSGFKLDALKEGYCHALFNIAKVKIRKALEKILEEREKKFDEAAKKMQEAEALADTAPPESVSPRKRSTTISPRKRSTTIFKKKENVEPVVVKPVNPYEIPVQEAKAKLENFEDDLLAIRKAVYASKAPREINRSNTTFKERSKTQLSPRLTTQSTVVSPRQSEEELSKRGRSVSLGASAGLSEQSITKKPQHLQSPRQMSPPVSVSRHHSEEDKSEVIIETPALDRETEILYALASGNQDELNVMQEKYYKIPSHADKDIRPAIVNAFAHFSREIPSFLNFPQLVKDTEISKAIVALFDYLVVLEHENLKRQKMPALFFFKKPPDDKIEGLVEQLSFFLNPKTGLKEANNRLSVLLNSNSNAGLLQNRGPFGFYRVQSALRSINNPQAVKNTLNGKFVNSDVEERLLKLYNVVKVAYEKPEDYDEGMVNSR